MSRWFGQSLSNIGGKLTELTREVLAEVPQADEVARKDDTSAVGAGAGTTLDIQVSGLEAQLKHARYQIEQLQAEKEEIAARCRLAETRLEELKAHQGDVDAFDPGGGFSRSSQEGVDEAGFNECFDLLPVDDDSRKPMASSSAFPLLVSVRSPQDVAAAALSPSGSDTLEFENRELRDQVKHLKAEVAHWKEVVKSQHQARKSSESIGSSSACAPESALVAEVTRLKRELTEAAERHDNELAELNEQHRRNVEELRKMHDAPKRRQRRPSNGDWDLWESDQSGDSRQSSDTMYTAAEQVGGKRAESWHRERELLMQQLREVEEANAKLRDELDAMQSWTTIQSRDVDDASTEESAATREHERLQAENASLTASMERIVLDHRTELAELEHKKDDAVELRDRIERLETERDEALKTIEFLKTATGEEDKTLVEELRARVAQLENENRELNDAYVDLNEQLERRQSESDDHVASNLELSRKLEALKNDLIEYEEKYERCKAENQKAMRHLEVLTGEFDRLKNDVSSARLSSETGTRSMQEDITRLSAELRDSLETREKLIDDVSEFQTMANTIEERVAALQKENRELRVQNGELAAALERMPDFKAAFAETQDELSLLGQTLKTFQLEYLRKEKTLREELQAALEETVRLKEEAKLSGTASPPGHHEPPHLALKLAEKEADIQGLREEHKTLIETVNYTESSLFECKQRNTQLQSLLDTKCAECTELERRLYSLMLKTKETERHVGAGEQPSIVVEEELVAGTKVRRNSKQSRASSRGGRLQQCAEIDAEAFCALQSQLAAAEQRLRDSLDLQLDYEMRLGVQNEQLAERAAERDEFERRVAESDERLAEEREARATDRKTFELREETTRRTLEDERTHLRELQTENDSLVKEMKALRERLETVRRALDEEQSRAGRLTAENEALSALRAALEAAQCALDEERTSVRTIRAENEKLTMERRMVDEHYAVVLKERDQLNEYLAQKHAEAVMYYGELQKAMAQCAELEAQTKGLEARLNEVATTSKRRADATTQSDGDERDVLKKRCEELEAQHFRDEEARATALEDAGRADARTDRVRAELAEKLRRVGELEESVKESERRMAVLVEENRRVREADEVTRMGAAPELANLQQQMAIAQQQKSRAIGELDFERQRNAALVVQIKTLEESEKRAQKELERLRAHLVEVEESYTRELEAAAAREADLTDQLREVREKLGSQSERTQTDRERLEDTVGDLTVQLESMAKQRDAAVLQLEEKQDELGKANKACTSLQQVLQHFQQERDSRLFDEVDKYKNEIRRLEGEKNDYVERCKKLQVELDGFAADMQAVAQMKQQLRTHESVLENLRKQVEERDQQNSDLLVHIGELQKVHDATIEKFLLKNLLLGYFTAPANKKNEVAHLLGSVLGFTSDEFKKIDASGSSGWLHFLRLGAATSASTGLPDGTAVAKSAGASLTEKFVQFLEHESSPKPPTAAMPLLSPATPTAANFRYTPPLSSLFAPNDGPPSASLTPGSLTSQSAFARSAAPFDPTRQFSPLGANVPPSSTTTRESVTAPQPQRSASSIGAPSSADILRQVLDTSIAKSSAPSS